MDDFTHLQKHCTLFKKKDPEELEFLLRDMKFFSRQYRANSFVVHQGQRAEFLGIVSEGLVEVQKLSPGGNILTLTHLGQGEIFGEAVLFSSWQTYPASIFTPEGCTILFIHKEHLLQIFSRDREIFIAFMESISNRMVLLSEKIQLLAMGSLQERVISYLLGESQRQNTDSFHLSLSRREMAEYLNIPRPSLSRELGKLRDQGYINFEGNRFSLDIKKLEQLLES